MFKLAELLWEESRRLYLIRMDDFSRAIEKCSQKKAACDAAQGAAHRSQGGRGALPRAPRQATRVPPHGSRHLPDRVRREGGPARGRGDGAVPGGHRAVPEVAALRRRVDDGRRALLRDRATGRRRRTRTSTSATTRRPATSRRSRSRGASGSSATPTQAAKDFKRVLDKAVEAERRAPRRSAGAAPRCATRRSSTSSWCSPRIARSRAKEVFDFLVSIDGEQYSRDVMVKVAESYGAQTEWDRVNDAYRFLIKMDPESIKAAEYQRDIVANWNSALDVDQAQEEIKVLLDELRPEHRVGEGAEEPRGARALARDHRGARRASPRRTSTARRSAARRPTKKAATSNLYSSRRRRAYEQYLAAFGTGKGAQREGDRDALLPRRHPVLQARQDRGGRRRVPRGRQERAGRQAPQGRAAQRDGRVREGAPEGHRRPHASSTPSTRSSARRSTSTRRCSPPTRRSSA